MQRQGSARNTTASGEQNGHRVRSVLPASWFGALLIMGTLWAVCNARYYEQFNAPQAQPAPAMQASTNTVAAVR